ncbi:MAG: hypothetical protein NTV34_07660 [Proteobacteria bacterium]|nr:hypothetical protein [Pseudomonadota bacterium]
MKPFRSAFAKDILSTLIANSIMFIAISSVFPETTWKAEPWAETATLFFNQVHSFSFFDFIFAKDFGYYTIGPRLIFWLNFALFGDRSFPVLVQSTGVFAALGTIALFSADLYNHVIQDRLTRILIAIFVSLGFGYGMFVFNNIGYFGIAAGLLVLIIDRRTKSTLVLATASVVGTVAITSKGFGITLWPVFLLAAFWEIRCRRYRVFACYAAVLILSFPQIFAVWQARSAMPGASNPLAPSIFIGNVLNLYLHSLTHFMTSFRGPYEQTVFVFQQATKWLVCAAFAGWILVRRRKFAVMTSFIWTQCAALSGLCLYVLTLRQEALDVRTPSNFASDSYYFFTGIAIKFGFAILICASAHELIKSKWLTRIFALSLLLVSGAIPYLEGQLPGSLNPFADPRNKFSEWHEFSKHLDYPGGFCIPINPGGQAYCSGNSSMQTARAFWDPQGIRLIIPPNIAKRIRGFCTIDPTAVPSTATISDDNSSVTAVLSGSVSVSRCFENARGNKGKEFEPALGSLKISFKNEAGEILKIDPGRIFLTTGP